MTSPYPHQSCGSAITVSWPSCLAAATRRSSPVCPAATETNVSTTSAASENRRSQLRFCSIRSPPDSNAFLPVRDAQRTTVSETVIPCRGLQLVGRGIHQRGHTLRPHDAPRQVAGGGALVQPPPQWLQKALLAAPTLAKPALCDPQDLLHEALHGLSGPQALNNRRASILPQRSPGVGHGIRQEAPELSEGFHPSQPQGGYDKGSVVRLLAGRTNFHCRGVSPRPGRVPRVVLVPEVGVDIGTVPAQVFCKRPVVLAEATAAPENVAGIVADIRDEFLHGHECPGCHARAVRPERAQQPFAP